MSNKNRGIHFLSRPGNGQKVKAKARKAITMDETQLIIQLFVDPDNDIRGH